MSEFVRQVKQPVKPLASRLGRLDIELTERCDNDCVHCCINLPVGDAAAPLGGPGPAAMAMTDADWPTARRDAQRCALAPGQP